MMPEYSAETREMLERAWVTRHGKSLDWFAWYGDDSPSPEEARRFRKMLDAEAYLDAALMLVPDHATYVSTEVCARNTPEQYCCAEVSWLIENEQEARFSGYGANSVQALLAAIQAARETDNAE